MGERRFAVVRRRRGDGRSEGAGSYKRWRRHAGSAAVLGVSADSTAGGAANIATRRQSDRRIPSRAARRGGATTRRARGSGGAVSARLLPPDRVAADAGTAGRFSRGVERQAASGLRATDRFTSG